MIISIEKANFTLVTEIWNKGFCDYMVPINMNEDALNHRISSLGLSKSYSAIFKKNQQYAGIILIGIQIIKNIKTMWIGGMSVAPEFRRQQIAKELMNYAKKLAKEENCDEIRLEVITTNTKAKKLYESLGFTELNKLAISEISTIPELTNSDFTFNKIDKNEIIDIENNLIPWQNRLIFTTNSYYINHNGTTIGFIGYNETPDAISIQQLELFDLPETNYIFDILGTLQKKYHKKIKLSNFNMSSFEYQKIKPSLLQPDLTQHQMILKMINNK